MSAPLARRAHMPAKRYLVCYKRAVPGTYQDSLIVIGRTPPSGFSQPIRLLWSRNVSLGSSLERMRLGHRLRRPGARV